MRPPESNPGEVLAEIAQGLRNAVQRRELTSDKALGISEKARRELGILGSLGYPSETGSTQLKPLIEEGKRLEKELPKAA